MWSPWRWDKTTKSSLDKSTPLALALPPRMSGLSPVSNRIRLPPYSTSAANPQSFSIADDLPKASYRIVICAFDGSAPAAPEGNNAAYPASSSPSAVVQSMMRVLDFICCLLVQRYRSAEESQQAHQLRSLLEALARIEQVEQCFDRRCQALGAWAQEIFCRDQHFRIDRFIHALHGSRRDHLLVESGRDANELPPHTLESHLHVRIIERRQAVNHAHPHRPPQRLLEQQRIPAQM